MLTMAETTFSFGFGLTDSSNDHLASSREQRTDDTPRAKAEEVQHSSKARDAPLALVGESLPILDEFWLYKGRVTGEQAASLLEDSRVSSSDLIPGAYEGGFKLWECSVDLCRFLVQHFKLQDVFTSAEPCQQLHGKHVLELGCGHGLPGIVALLGGAAVHFQDYNKEVLRELTIPATQENLKRLPAGRTRPPTRYFAGDWANVGEMLTGQGFGGHYDMILTAETLYSVEAQFRLLECIKQLLQPPHGVVYVASKSYYFGVGGGTASFERLVKNDGIFECRTVFKDGDAGEGSVKRVILELTFPESIMPYFL